MWFRYLAGGLIFATSRTSADAPVTPPPIRQKIVRQTSDGTTSRVMP